MGSWNKTCGLSNLHITAGTPVYVFVLEEARDTSNCYSTSLFSPLLLPFESEYNDYGGGENSSGVAFDLIMNAIKSELFEMAEVENQYHDIAVKAENFGEELFFDAVHENRLLMKNPYGEKPVHLRFTMFRKDVVDAILENHEIEKYVGDGRGTHGWDNSYIRYRFKDILSDLRPLLEQIASSEAGIDKRWFSGIEMFLHENRSNLAATWLTHDNYRYSRIVDIRMLIAEALEKNTPDALDGLEAVLIEHLKALFIDGFMHQARKTWIPGGHEGSQSANASAHRLLCNTILGVLDREREEWLRENEGEEYWEE